MNEEEKKAIEHFKELITGKRIFLNRKSIEILINLIERQQDMIKNALYILNKNEKEKIDQTWLYNFDKCATLKEGNE